MNYDVYFIGICGVSMSALAILSKKSGKVVGGSDINRNVSLLQKEDIDVDFEPNFDSIKNSKLIVVSSAISDSDEQVVYARSIKKKILTRGEFLGRLARGYKNIIAVAGAHGKTTTTGLVYSIFKSAGKNPTVHIGGILRDTKTNYVFGGDEFFITEACEYKNNFLNLAPTLSVVLNVESEHLDFFKNFENVEKAFKTFVSNSKFAITCDGFGDFKKHFSYQNFSDGELCCEFDVFEDSNFYGHIKTHLHGRHNAENILYALEVGRFFNLDKEKILEGVSNFQGIERRQEEYHFKRGKIIYDYAHHPTEILKSITDLRERFDGKIIVLFQPHTYSRTKNFLADFVSVLKKADEVVIFKTYSARESFDEHGDAKRIYEELKDVLKASYSEDYHILEKFDVKEHEVLLVLGAGDFYDKTIDFVRQNDKKIQKNDKKS